MNTGGDDAFKSIISDIGNWLINILIFRFRQQRNNGR